MVQSAKGKAQRRTAAVCGCSEPRNTCQMLSAKHMICDTRFMFELPYRSARPKARRQLGLVGPHFILCSRYELLLVDATSPLEQMHFSAALHCRYSRLLGTAVGQKKVIYNMQFMFKLPYRSARPKARRQLSLVNPRGPTLFCLRAMNFFGSMRQALWHSP